MQNLTRRGTPFTGIIVLVLALGAAAGDTDSPAAPSDPASAMYRLEDIYNRLDTGAAGAKRAGAFEEPTAGDFAAAGGPGDSGPTLDDVMGAAPAANGNAATAGDVLSGKVFWGLGALVWGQQTGTVPAGNALTGADGSLTITITDGLYTGSKTATAQDSDLTSGNIRSGANIFGVAGDSNVVNTSSGDATAGDIATGKKAWVDGAEITGTAGGGSGAAVEKTGQTTSYATGDDGDLETGVVWPSPRFTDNSDGTVTDNLTGLIWLKDADAGDGTETWADALNICNSLATGQQGLSDGSSAGDWRLPTVKELHSLIDFGNVLPALPTGHPFSGVQSSRYLSSTASADSTAHAWGVDVGNGGVYPSTKTNTYYVWPVRGGE
jgi:hypothetical protein